MHAFWLSAFLLISGSALATDYSIDYTFTLEPKKKRAHVNIHIDNPDLVNEINFNLADSTCKKFESNTTIKQEDKRLIWKPTGDTAWLRYQCSINHKRATKTRKKAYDALITKDWAIFRGDDFVPPARVSTKNKAESKARLHFKLPKDWPSVNTGWARDLSEKDHSNHKNTPTFLIDNPERRFDRPTGWMIAGQIGTRRVKFEESDSISRVAVSAPAKSSFQQMDALTFIQFIWPELKTAFGSTPEKLLIVGADDPMWRGGLSAGNSFYMHAARPLVSENGTSTLIHELFHMTTGIRGKKNADWIAEGLAEYYSFELIKRAGGMHKSRYERTINTLKKWSTDVTRLEKSHSRGTTTAAAALLFLELDHEIKTESQNAYSLDNIVQQLMPHGKVNRHDLEQAIFTYLGKPSSTLSNYVKKGLLTE